MSTGWDQYSIDAHSLYVELEIYEGRKCHCENVQGRTKHDAYAATERRIFELQPLGTRRRTYRFPQALK
jgi:hypothetical protein